jgi:hypothetical protein
MKAKTLAFCFLTVAVACSGDARLSECRGFVACANEGTIDVTLVVERCDESEGCTLEALDRSPFLELIQLDGDPDEHCGPDDCGAVPDALRIEGWSVGTWRLVAPPIRDLEPPDPIVIEVKEGEETKVTLTYTESS